MYNTRAARQGWPVMDLFTWDPFPPVLSSQPSCLQGEEMPGSWEFWISNDPNSFSAMIQVSCTLFGNQTVGSPALHCPELPACPGVLATWPWNSWLSSSLVVP